MGILINNMTMPNDGHAFVEIFPDGIARYKSYEGQYITMADTTAIELSDKYRIIDLEKVRSKIDPIINWSVISKLLEDAFVETCK